MSGAVRRRERSVIREFGLDKAHQGEGRVEELIVIWVTCQMVLDGASN